MPGSDQTHSVILPRGVNLNAQESRIISSPVMRKLLVSLAAGVLLLVTCVYGMLRRKSNSDPVFRGKHLSAWLWNYDADMNGAAWLEADDAIQRMGATALPYLLRESCVSRDPAAWQLNLNRCLVMCHLPCWRLSSAEDRRRRAGDAFHALQKDATAVASSLTGIGIRAKRNGDGSQEYLSIHGLGLLGPGASNAVPFLCEEATTKDALTRVEAFWALQVIHSNPELSVPALADGLMDPDPRIRERAAYGLSNFGAAAQSALPQLKRLVQEENDLMTRFPDSVQHRSAHGAAQHAVSTIAAASASQSATNGTTSTPPRKRDDG
jgi:HEAT repeat protein